MHTPHCSTCADMSISSLQDPYLPPDTASRLLRGDNRQPTALQPRRSCRQLSAPTIWRSSSIRRTPRRHVWCRRCQRHEWQSAWPRWGLWRTRAASRQPVRWGQRHEWLWRGCGQPRWCRHVQRAPSTVRRSASSAAAPAAPPAAVRRSASAELRRWVWQVD
jgi:hypothetical protein